MMKHACRTIAATAVLAAGATAPAFAEHSFKVIGTWGVGAMYKEHEAPLWETAIPEASGGKVTGEIKAMTDLGLKGFETVKLLKTGVYDVGFGAYTYIASGNPVFEGIDLALTPKNTDEARRLVEAYDPVVKKAFADIHGVELLASYPFPAQVLVCRDPFESLADLKGRKIRVYSTTLGDMAEGFGGVSVSIPLSEVVPALQRGVVDCGVSSGVSMYHAKWQDVVNYLYETPVSAGIAFLAMNKAKFDALDEETQTLLTEQSRIFADKAWAALKDSEQQGISCLTGEGGSCRYGDPAGMTLVKANPDDEPLRRSILEDYVLKRYAERCGADCAAEWNATAGAVIGLSATQ